MIAIVTLLAVAAPSWSQAFCIGKNGKDCTDAEFNERFCKPEKAPANLFLAQPAQISGTFLDPTGTPLNFDAIKPEYHTIAQIKSLDTGVVLFAVPVNAKGQFEFESVPAGNYRLIVVWMKDGKLRRLPLTDQPAEIRCSGSTECNFRSVLATHGTDNLVDFCPPK